jgi:hypothetical protein
MKLKVTSKVTPSHAANDMSIMLDFTFITTGELPQAAMALNKDITLTIKENQKDTIMHAEITLELLYEGETLEKGVTQQKFYWEPINSVAEELFTAIDAWGIDEKAIKTINEILESPIKQAKLKPDARNKNKDSFLFAAYNKCKEQDHLHNTYHDLLKALFKIPGDINSQMDGGISKSMGDFVAAHLSNNNVTVDVIKMLMERAPLPTCIHECLRYIHLADEMANPAVITKLAFLLVSYSTYTHTKDSNGNTPLHIAVSHITSDNVTAIKKLKAKGATFDVPNNEGKTPRDVANATMDDFKKQYLTHYPIYSKDQDSFTKFKNACTS